MTPPTNEDNTLFATRQAADAWQRGGASREDLLGPATQQMLDLAGVGPGRHVLDVAAGTGEQALMAARQVGPAGAVLATDVATPMLERAAASARQAGLDWMTTQVMDAHDLALPGDHFDAVICRQGLMYLADLDRALAGMRRVLRDGGHLAALVWSSPARNPALALTLAVGHRHAGPTSPRPEQVQMFALSDPATLSTALMRAGFREVAIHPTPILRRYPSAADAARDQRTSFVALHPYLTGLSEPDQAQVWEEIEHGLRRFEGQRGYEAPGELLIAVGTK